EMKGEKDLVNEGKRRRDVGEKLGGGKEINCGMSNLRDGIENKEEMKGRSGYMKGDGSKVRG
ncbi:hypothetical protein, partial [Staphylococcus epidermidis]|uniref:hypothetical protein n=1 Tax=Staphylococcus epidermidis TaxID=1282 RepID=UPI001C93476B